jgi:hypothetical protein
MSDIALSNMEVARQIQEALAPLQVVPISEELPNEQPIGKLRRYPNRVADEVGILTLIDVDGVLIWQDGAVSPALSTGRRARGRTYADGEVVTQLKYSKLLGSNQIGEKLRQLDGRLTPLGPAELVEYDRDTWEGRSGAHPIEKGQVLLFVHGTFSSCGNMISEFRGDDASPHPGRLFLEKAAKHYDQILGYDHFTLSRTPVINAADLARRSAESKADLDIVCHSRGGLVVRWLCEQLDRVPNRKRRVVFVGCPFRGTSLADPESLRNGLTLLTNVGKLLGTTVGLVPLLAAAGGLIQILSSAGALVARTPAADAMVGLVPGLAAMSRIVNNAELDSLNFGPPVARTDYFAVVSNFQTAAAGWKFWKMFNMLKVADHAADYLVFNQDNDLVVDTESMTYHAFGDNPEVERNADVFCYFNETKQVHHTTYFRESPTVEFLVRVFRL